MRYYRPVTLRDALRTLDSERSRARILAGGTDLVVQLQEGLLRPRALVDVSALGILHGIRAGQEKIRVGALATHEELASSSLLRRHAFVLSEAAGTVGAPQIRNRGTIGGNIANASPAADTVPALIALGAAAVLERLGARRLVPVEDLFLGPGATAIRPDELIIAVLIPRRERSAGAYIKLGHRNALAISIASAAVLLADRGPAGIHARIALGAVAPTVVRPRQAESFLKTSSRFPAAFRDAAALSVESASPITDIRASAGYRREMIQVVVLDALREAWSRLGGSAHPRQTQAAAGRTSREDKKRWPES
jgi:CO/xanthine dehydrogenase FAD-binding subunit